MIEQRIRARIGAYSVPAVVHAVQGDTGRVFVFELEDYTITGEEGASLNCERPDGTFFTYAGTVDASTNFVTVPLDIEGGALSQDGTVIFQLELTKDDKIVCAFKGSILVEPVVGGEATQDEKDFRDAIQGQLNNKASNIQLAQVESNLIHSIDAVADDLTQEILDREAADATKANKSTTINGKSLAEDRVIYAQDIPSKNLLPNNASTQTINGVTFTVNDDGSITANGTASATTILWWAISIPSGAYILNGCPSGGGVNSYRMYLGTSGGTVESNIIDAGAGYSFTLSSAYSGGFGIRIASGYTCSNLTFRPMIRLASIEDAEYVPYSKTAVELSRSQLPIRFIPPVYSERFTVQFSSCYRIGNMVLISIRGLANQAFAGNTAFTNIPVSLEYAPLSVVVSGNNGAYGEVRNTADGIVLYNVPSGALCTITGVYICAS